MSRKTLSIMPYYGGKARMAHFIAERLNYDDSDIYIEPFGGACRVLLNKPSHKVEIYNDYGEGVTTVMRTLSDPKFATEYIYRLFETEYSEEQFRWAKEIFDTAEMDLQEHRGRTLIKELKNLLVNYGIIPARVNARTFKAILENEDSFRFLVNLLKDDSTPMKVHLAGKIKGILADYTAIKELKQEQGFIERTRDSGIYISDMDLAVATYIVFTQSRDAMGQVWTASRFKSTDHYRRQIIKLFDCAQRMEGVQIYNIDAMDFFRWYIGVNRDDSINAVNNDYAVMLRWIHDPKVMMYCDPSYINPKHEEKLLEGIDWKNTDSLSQEIKRYHGVNMPSNLGKIYAMSFNYEDQENFLKCIYDADCKLMVSNYDLILYNKYLTAENGWKRIEFETTTGVGSKADNKRVEVLWYNY